MNDNDPCPHCGALCADVELARAIRKIMAVRRHMFVKESLEPDAPVLRFMAESVAADWRDSTIDHYDVANGDTLDAALAELAKKIGGSE